MRTLSPFVALGIALGLSLAPGPAIAAAAAPAIAEGVKFWHEDWELACDNTGKSAR